jgi:ATP-dependent RNA helicase DDX27
MERILQRGGGKIRLSTQKSQKQNQLAATRGLVLTPTRELAAQCLGMMNAMAKFTDLRASLIVGGARNINAQAAELRTRPDVIVATPGRLIDHLTNSSGVDLDDLEFLILDEADRLCKYIKSLGIFFHSYEFTCIYIYAYIFIYTHIIIVSFLISLTTLFIIGISQFLFQQWICKCIHNAIVIELFAIISYVLFSHDYHSLHTFRGFQDEVHEIVKACPAERQTLLFSATLGTKVDDLIRLSLKRPVRVHVTDHNGPEGSNVEVANRLEQEFVRVRTSNEGVNREAMLLALLTRTYAKRVIVFFDTKADAHRLMIVSGLCGIKCAEIHGNLTQVQRLEALEEFREGSVDILLATDVAARGLDISSVEAVINFEMPGIVDTYVHRIGRTARAGRAGKACTLIGEGRRQLMKAIMKDAEHKRLLEESKASKGRGKASSSTGAIRSRTIPTAVLKHFAAKIISLEPHVMEVLSAEAVARMDRIADMEAMKAQNLIQHGDEIKARPNREWFTSKKETVSARERYLIKQEEIKEKIGTGMHRMTRKKRRMREAKQEQAAMQEEAMEQFEETGQRTKKVMTEGAVKSTAKAQKNSALEKEKERDSRSLHDEDTERKEKRKLKDKAAKKKKGAFAIDALGDSGLFGDEIITHEAKPKKAKVAKSQFEFTEYDPNKATRKNKAKAHHGFKSKSKFKRRK